MFNIIKLLTIAFLILTNLSCSETENTHDIIKILKSPSGKSIFYSVYDESTMAFGSGRSRFIILDSTQSINKVSEEDFLQLPSGNIMKVLGWQDDYNLKVLNISSGLQPKDLNPFKIDTLTFKKWNIIMNHYHANAFINGSKQIEEIEIHSDSITFRSSDNFERTVLNGQVSINQNNLDRQIEICCLEKDMNFVRLNAKKETLRGQPKVALVHYNPVLSQIDFDKLDTNKICRIIEKKTKKTN